MLYSFIVTFLLVTAILASPLPQSPGAHAVDPPGESTLLPSRKPSNLLLRRLFRRQYGSNVDREAVDSIGYPPQQPHGFPGSQPDPSSRDSPIPLGQPRGSSSSQLSHARILLGLRQPQDSPLVQKTVPPSVPSQEEVNDAQPLHQDSWRRLRPVPPVPPAKDHDPLRSLNLIWLNHPDRSWSSKQESPESNQMVPEGRQTQSAVDGPSPSQKNIRLGRPEEYPHTSSRPPP